MTTEKSTEPFAVEVIGTLLGLIIVGAIAWCFKYVRSGMTPPDSKFLTILILVLIGFGLAFLGPRIIREIRKA